jgi:hypothetical protein
MKLLEALNIAKSCVSEGDIVQILSHICIHEGEILTYNGAQAVLISGIDELSEISCAVPGDMFIKLLSSLPPSTEIEPYEDHIKIVCKKTKTNIRLSSIKRKRFIFKKKDIEDHINEDKYIVINKAFIDGLSKCIDTTKNDESKVEQTGITISWGGKNQKIEMYSTDSVQLSRYTLITNTNFKDKLMIPKAFCKMIIDFRELMLGKRMCISDNSLVIVSNDVYFFSHLIPDIVFMPFEKIIKENYTENLFMFDVPKRLPSVLSRCMLISSTEEKKINITTKTGSTSVELLGVSDIGEIKERLIIKNESEFDDNVFTVNGDFLKNMLPHVTEIGFNRRDKHSTTIVGRNEEDTFVRLLACFHGSTERKEETTEEDDE